MKAHKYKSRATGVELIHKSKREKLNAALEQKKNAISFLLYSEQIIFWNGAN